RPAAVAVGVPRRGQVQRAVEQRLEAAAGDGQMDGDDPVVDLADAAEILSLDARRLCTLLDGAGLVEDADGAQAGGREVGRRVTQASRNRIGEAPVTPQAGFEELLEVA